MLIMITCKPLKLEVSTSDILFFTLIFSPILSLAAPPQDSDRHSAVSDSTGEWLQLNVPGLFDWQLEFVELRTKDFLMYLAVIHASLISLE